MRVERFDRAVEAALGQAHQRNVYLIARFQDVHERSLRASEGAVERMAELRASGVGLHVFTPEGHCGFASSDDSSEVAVRDLVNRAADLAAAGRSLDGDVNRAAYQIGPNRQRPETRAFRELASVPLGQVTRMLADANRTIGGAAGGLSVRSRYVAVDDQWRIVRSDGTDVSFAVPRAYLHHGLTGRVADAIVSSGANVSGADVGLPLDPTMMELLDRRARSSIDRLRATAGAPSVPEGSYRVVIDHALAKGLAHEAFGHACETDVAPGSILADESGRMRLGEQVGPPSVSIVDEPIEGDLASQHVSANGLVRRTAQLIRDGVLTSGLGDLFSAARAGSPITGACRAGGYRRRPTPRMTNIRLVVRDPLPLADTDGVVEADTVAAAMRAAGLLDRDQPCLYLAGYRGGQANPRDGSFVFTSAAAFDVSDGCAPRGSAVLSGHSLTALRSIVAAFGRLRLDAMGICDKNGESVPTSGGSHALLVLETNPDLSVGPAR
jgi:TldD protein